MTRDEVFKAIDIADMAALKDILDKNPKLASCHSNDGMSAVLFSLYINQPSITSLILSFKPDLDIYDLAALGGAAQISAVIATNPKIIHEYNGVGFTALHIASYFGHADIVTLILENDGDVDKLTMDGSDLTALQSAVSNLKYDAVDALLKFNPNVDVRMLGGFTPLMTAAALGSKELVLKLIKHDADITLVSDDGRDASAFALSSGQNEVVDLLS
jgi:ankyrin repeat protein